MTQALRSIVDSVHKLKPEDKRELLNILDEELAQYEEKMFEQDPNVIAQIREARGEYEAGKYVTIEEYIKNRQKKK